MKKHTSPYWIHSSEKILEVNVSGAPVKLFDFQPAKY